LPVTKNRKDFNWQIFMQKTDKIYNIWNILSQTQDVTGGRLGYLLTGNFSDIFRKFRSEEKNENFLRKSVDKCSDI